MKISAFTFATLMGLAIAQPSTQGSFKLRASLATSSAPIATTVLVKGVTTQATEADVQTINDSVVLAFNSIYGPSTGTFIEAVNDDNEVPDKLGCGGWGCGGYDHNNWFHRAYRWYGRTFPWDCPLCPVDDAFLSSNADQDEEDGVFVIGRVQTVSTAAAALPTRRLLADDAMHSKFEEALCDLLRSSAANMADAKDCTFSFIEAPGDQVACEGSTKTEALLLMQGVDEITDEDLALVETIAAAAYKESFELAGSQLASFDVYGTAEDDDGDAAIVAVEFFEVCSHGASVETKDVTEMESKFEKAFCGKLKASGSDFADLKTCGFHVISRQSKSQSTE